MDAYVWRNKLEMELDRSGLPDAIKKLTREMVDQAKQRAFMAEGEAICKQLRKINQAQESVFCSPRDLLAYLFITGASYWRLDEAETSLRMLKRNTNERVASLPYLLTPGMSMNYNK